MANYHQGQPNTTPSPCRPGLQQQLQSRCSYVVPVLDAVDPVMDVQRLSTKKLLFYHIHFQEYTHTCSTASRKASHYILLNAPMVVLKYFQNFRMWRCMTVSNRSSIISHDHQRTPHLSDQLIPLSVRYFNLYYKLYRHVNYKTQIIKMQGKLSSVIVDTCKSLHRLNPTLYVNNNHSINHNEIRTIQYATHKNPSHREHALITKIVWTPEIVGSPHDVHSDAPLHDTTHVAIGNGNQILIYTLNIQV